MGKIVFLLADELLKKEVESILWIYRPEEENGLSSKLNNLLPEEHRSLLPIAGLIKF